MDNVDVVLIGRNEGQRLVQALKAVAGVVRSVVYVDSGSSDDSVAQAKMHGAVVVELDMSIPFTAARARNAGFAALESPELVQFIDGDCALVEGFLNAAAAHLDANPEIGIVTGWRAEIFPDASVYNLLAHIEWRQPAGPIVTCGGDMMVRAAAFEMVGGFNPNVIAAEDDDFCLRVGKANWGLERLPLEMTRHDADMHKFSQWWQRATRAGHGFAQVDRLHPGHFRRPLLRVAFWAIFVPVLALITFSVTWLGVVAAIALYGLSFWRSRQRLAADAQTAPKASALAGLLTISKIPNLIGIFTYYRRVATGRDMVLIEYK